MAQPRRRYTQGGSAGSAATAVFGQIHNKTPDDGHHGSEGHDVSYKTHPHNTPVVHPSGVWQPEGPGSQMKVVGGGKCPNFALEGLMGLKLQGQVPNTMLQKHTQGSPTS